LYCLKLCVYSKKCCALAYKELCMKNGVLVDYRKNTAKSAVSQGLRKMDIYEVNGSVYFVLKVLKIETITANVIPVLELYGRYIKKNS